MKSALPFMNVEQCRMDHGMGQNIGRIFGI